MRTVSTCSACRGWGQSRVAGPLLGWRRSVPVPFAFRPRSTLHFTMSPLRAAEMSPGDPCELSPAFLELVRDTCGQQSWHLLKSKCMRLLPGTSPPGLSILPPHMSLPGSCPRARQGAHCSGLFLGHHHWLVGGVFLILTLSFCQKSKKILYPKFFQCLAMCLTSIKDKSGRAWGGG